MPPMPGHLLEGSEWAGECIGAGWEQINQGGFLGEEDFEFSRPSPISQAKCMQRWVLVLLWVWPDEIMADHGAAHGQLHPRELNFPP